MARKKKLDLPPTTDAVLEKNIEQLGKKAEKAIATKEEYEERVKSGKGTSVAVNRNTAMHAAPYLSNSGNSKYIAHLKEIYGLGPIDNGDPEAIYTRTMEYLDLCVKNGIQTSIPSYALALRMTRQEFKGIIDGRVSRSKKAVEVLKFGASFVEAEMIDTVQGGGMNPVTAIFVSKNSFGYVSEEKKQEEKIDPLGTLKDADEIAEKYKDMPDE